MVIPIVISIYALVDVVTTPTRRIRALPKWLWMMTVLLLPLVGVALWFGFGRPSRRSHVATTKPDHRVLGPDDDPEFLRSLRRPRRP